MGGGYKRWCGRAGGGRPHRGGKPGHDTTRRAHATQSKTGLHTRPSAAKKPGAPPSSTATRPWPSGSAPPGRGGGGPPRAPARLLAAEPHAPLQRLGSAYMHPPTPPSTVAVSGIVQVFRESNRLDGFTKPCPKFQLLSSRFPGFNELLYEH